MSEACPCGRGEYASCCLPLHRGQQFAQSAEQLMRSRYSAFAKHQIDYLKNTTAPGQQAALDLKAISEWSQANRWLRLEIVQANEKLDKAHALVEFKAYYQADQQIQLHHEVSHFVKSEQRWYFLDPTADQRLSMKQPCVCGSGKKFKQCCAHFL